MTNQTKTKHVPLEELDEPPPFNFLKEGSFGLFSTNGSVPIEYLLTTFLPHEIGRLVLARDVRPTPGYLDFELLMQRDINEVRAREEIAEYLDPQNKPQTSSELRARAVFFPPLLAAIVNTSGNQILPTYSDEQIEYEDAKYLTRIWPGQFQVTLRKGAAGDSHVIQLPNGKSERVRQAPARLQLQISQAEEPGVKLVVIDGQHRLFALREIHDKDPALLKDIVLPVCILFSPASTPQGMADAETKGFRAPSVPEIFRHLFVDVNETAEVVGGHFTILLGDNRMSSIAMRGFCDAVLKDPALGQDALALVEWNERKPKDSTLVKKDYSITSIGLVDLALSETIGHYRKQDLLYNLLDLNNEEVASRLNPPSSDEPKVEWDRFSLRQKYVLQDALKARLVPCLKTIFFETSCYKKLLDHVRTELADMKALGAKNDEQAPAARNVHAYITEYRPLKSDYEPFYNSFNEAVRDWKEQNLPPLVTHALFQRALFVLWEKLLLRAQKYAAPPDITRGLVTLLDHALTPTFNLITPKRKYCQNSIFREEAIWVRTETRNQISRLLLAVAGNKKRAGEVCKSMQIPSNATGGFIERLTSDGRTAAEAFMGRYEEDRTKAFKASYTFYDWLTATEIQELDEAQQEEERIRAALKKGQLKEAPEQWPFEELIKRRVRPEIEAAASELKKALQYEDQIVGIDVDDVSSEQ